MKKGRDKNIQKFALNVNRFLRKADGELIGLIGLGVGSKYNFLVEQVLCTTKYVFIIVDLFFMFQNKH